MLHSLNIYITVLPRETMTGVYRRMWSHHHHHMATRLRRRVKMFPSQQTKLTACLSSYMCKTWVSSIDTIFKCTGWQYQNQWLWVAVFPLSHGCTTFDIDFLPQSWQSCQQQMWCACQDFQMRPPLSINSICISPCTVCDSCCGEWCRLFMHMFRISRLSTTVKAIISLCVCVCVVIFKAFDIHGLFFLR